MIDEDDEDEYNRMFDRIDKSEKSSQSEEKKVNDNFEDKYSDLFLSELGNILLSNEDKSDNAQNESIDDI